MYTKYAFLLVVALLVASASCEEKRKCIDGKSYHDGCNNCWCNNGSIACTLKACQMQDPETGKWVPTKTESPPEDFWES